MGSYKLSNEQLDILKEIGNIGAGNSATALSQLLGKQVRITVPKINLVSAQDISVDPVFVANPEEIGVAVSLSILGALTGGMLVLFSHSSALTMIDVLMRRKMGTTQFFNVMDASALSEGSNILCCSYLNAVTEFLKLYKLVPSVNQVYMDKMDRLAKILVRGFVDSRTGFILPIENRLIIEDIELNLHVLFLLEFDSINRIFQSVGL
jgi:chemotaxis protein CheC